MEVIQYVGISCGVFFPLAGFVWWINIREIAYQNKILKNEIDKEHKDEREKMELRITKNLADAKIEIQKEMLDSRDRTEKKIDELFTQLLSQGSKLDIFYKALTDDVSRNTYEIGKLKQAKEDRDKHFDDLRDEMRTGFKTINERLDRIRVQ